MGSWIFNRQNNCAVNLEHYTAVRWFKDDMVIEFSRGEVREYPGEKGPDYQGPPPESTGIHVDFLEWVFQTEEEFDQAVNDLLGYLEAARIGEE